MSDTNGVIYILTNKSFPDYIKIGYTYNLDKKLKQLNKAECLPYPFEVYATYEVGNFMENKDFHEIIMNLNPNITVLEGFNAKPKVEFYEMEPEDAYDLFKSVAKLTGTENNLIKVEKESDIRPDIFVDLVEQHKNKKRSPFSFIKCGISIGEEINFIKDPKYHARVEDARHVYYDGDLYTLSALTTRLVNANRWLQNNGMQTVIKDGPRYWSYKGVPLNVMRKRYEEMENDL